MYQQFDASGPGQTSIGLQGVRASNPIGALSLAREHVRPSGDQGEYAQTPDIRTQGVSDYRQRSQAAAYTPRGYRAAGDPTATPAPPSSPYSSNLTQDLSTLAGSALNLTAATIQNILTNGNQAQMQQLHDQAAEEIARLNAQAAQATSAAAQTAAQQQIAALQALQAQAAANGAQPTGLTASQKTLLYTGLAIGGVVIIGGIAYVLMSKPRRNPVRRRKGADGKMHRYYERPGKKHKRSKSKRKGRKGHRH